MTRKIIAKGAMFGLDARIALSIFGALSVISGAALYSAIQQSKLIALMTQISEITKAYEQYLLDTGTAIRKVTAINPTHHNAEHSFHAPDLTTDSGVSDWKDPYLSLDLKVTDPEASFSTGGHDYILIYADDTKLGTAPAQCSADNNCKFFI